MLLADTKYLDNFEKLPQFRMLMNDEECLNIVIKILYLAIENHSGQTAKQKDFLISFCKSFLCRGFIEKNVKNLKAIEMPKELIDDIKDGETFYSNYKDGEFKYDIDFSTFFLEQEKEVIVKIGTTRTDCNQAIPPLRSADALLESEQEDTSSVNDAKSGNSQSNKSADPYLYVSKTEL